MNNTKQYRVLEIFFRGLRGEDLSVQELAGNTELQYSYSDKGEDGTNYRTCVVIENQ